MTDGTKRRRGWGWLVLAAALLLLGAWVMRGAEPPEARPPPKVSLPQQMTEAEWTRNTRRRVVAAPPADPEAPELPQRARDPLLVLMPEKIKRLAVVAEVSAILNSELGGLVFECAFAGAQGPLESLRAAGFDPQQHLDRVALIDDALVLTGQLENLPWPPESASRAYGADARLIALRPEAENAPHVGVWKNQLAVFGRDEAEVTAQLDRLQRGEAPERSALDESMAYGEVYGRLTPAAVAELFSGESSGLGELIGRATDGMQLHLDVSEDLGMVADIEGHPGTETEDLRRSLGSMLSLARIRAQAEGATTAASILDLARVGGANPDGHFRLEAGVPGALIRNALRACVERGRARAVEAASVDAGLPD